jgi:cytosine/adenosine deaminase-related metal-dependent hydrolase
LLPGNDVTRLIDCEHILPGPPAEPIGSARLVLDGERIGQVTALTVSAPSILAMPVFANAHDHARAARSSSIGAGGKPLETWLHYLAMLPAVDPYNAAAVSLSHSALGGAGTVMVHYTRVQGLTDYVTEAKAVAKAARDVGVRVGFAVALRDRNPLVYGPSEPILAALPREAAEEIRKRFLRAPLPVSEQIALVDAVAAGCDAPNFNVQYGPAAVQWCSDPLLRAVAEASARTGRRIHMHCLETRYQRDWADREFPNGMIRYLDEIGLLSPRLTLAHCTYARPDELDLLAERGVTISVNTSSNLGIRSGIAPLAQMKKAGCRVALGIDGLALDEDDDSLREMRLAHLLHGGKGFEVDVSRDDILTMACRNGRFSVLNRDDGGSISAGGPADILLLDWARVDDDRLKADLDPRDLLFARVTADHIEEVIVAGSSIVKDGQVTGIDYPALREELLARFRSGIGGNAALASALKQLETAVAANFGGTPCC